MAKSTKLVLSVRLPGFLRFTLWQTNMAMKHAPFEDVFPSQKCADIHCYVNNLPGLPVPELVW